MADYQSNTTQAAGLYQLSLWSAANLAEMVAGRLAVRETFFRRLLKKLSPSRAGAIFRARRTSNEESLPLLADAVVGTTRATVFALFGPPGGVAVESVPDDGLASAVWEAGTWYYPLPQNGPVAMAVTFDRDQAKCVEFFEMPES